MKIAIIGASGQSGSLVMQEALDRGHQVTAIVRSPEKLPRDSAIDVIKKDIFELTAADLTSYDVVVNAFNATFGNEEQHASAGHVLIEALKGHTNTRLAIVGSGGSLFTDESRSERIHESAGFPAQFLDTALQMRKNLEELQSTSDLNWVYLSPCGLFDAQGKRTGRYDTGNDVALVNSKGEAYTSYADFAIAMLDEIEQPEHRNERYAVVSES